MENKVVSEKEFPKTNRLVMLLEGCINDIERVGYIVKTLSEFVRILRVKQEQGHELGEFASYITELIDSGLPVDISLPAVEVVEYFESNKVYDFYLEAHWLGMSAPEMILAKDSGENIELDLLPLLTHDSGLGILEKIDLSEINFNQGYSLKELLERLNNLKQVVKKDIPLWQL